MLATYPFKPSVFSFSKGQFSLKVNTLLLQQISVTTFFYTFSLGPEHWAAVVLLFYQLRNQSSN